jgi:WD40 repeat protein
MGHIFDIAAQPAAASNQVTYTAVAGNNSPYFKVYDGTLTALTNPASLPGGAATGVALSPNKDMVVVTTYSSPYVHFYTLDGSAQPVKLSNPATLPPDAAESVAWSDDGKWVVVGHDTSPFITIYDMTSGAPVKISDPATLPTSRPQANGVAFDGQSAVLAVTQRLTPFMLVYDISGSTFTALTNPASLPAAQPYGVAVNEAGTAIVYAELTSNGVFLVDKDGTTLTKLSDPASNVNNCRAPFFYGDDGYFAIAAGSNLEPYSFDGTTATKQTTPEAAATTIVASAFHKPSGLSLVAAGTNVEMHQPFNALGQSFGFDHKASANPISPGIGNVNAVAMV